MCEHERAQPGTVRNANKLLLQLVHIQDKGPMAFCNSFTSRSGQEPIGAHVHLDKMRSAEMLQHKTAILARKSTQFNINFSNWALNSKNTPVQSYI